MTQTLNNSHELVAPFLTQPLAIDWHQLIARRPALLADYHDLPQYLLKPEVTSLLDSIYDHTDRFLLNTLWHTGARVTEALSLRPDSFHLERAGGAYVVLKTLKQGRPGVNDTPARRVPLRDPRYIHAVKRYIQSQHIRKKRKFFPMHRATVFKHVRKWVRAHEQARGQAFGLDVSPHTFRHSFAVNALLHMVPLTVIQAWLGHKRLENTAVYLKIFAPDNDPFMEWVSFE